MSCAFHGYGSDEACAISCRVQEVTHAPINTDCPHNGKGEDCEFIKAKLAESNQIEGK